MHRLRALLFAAWVAALPALADPPATPPATPAVKPPATTPAPLPAPPAATPAPKPAATPLPAPASPPATPVAKPPAAAPVPATPVATPPAAKLQEFKTADELWAHFQALQRGPQGQGMTTDERAKAFREFVTELHATAERFATTYPTDPRRWEARLAATRLLQKVANAIPQTDVEKLYREAAAAADAPPDIKTRARLGMIQMHREALKSDSPKEAVAAVDAEIVAFAKDFPTHDQLPWLQTSRAQLWDKRDAPKALVILDELTKNPNPDVAQEAAGQLRFRNIKKQPLALRFTAVDGREVNLEAMRGKVVLINFWSISNGAAVAELPKIAAVYEKLRGQGFEVIGVAQERDKEKLLAFLLEKQVTWPQYFDGKGSKNDLARSYALRSIPAFWLVNKQGFVVHTDARADLEALAAKLLVEE